MADDRRYEGNNWKRVGGGGGELSQKASYYNYSCPVSLKLNQVLLVTSQPVNIAAWLIVLQYRDDLGSVLYCSQLVLRLYNNSLRTNLHSGRQQPWDERAAADRTDNLAVNGNRALPQEHER